MKPIRLKVLGRIDHTGHQIVYFVIYSRKRNRKYALSLTLSGYPDDDRYLLRTALPRLRDGWRNELLGKDWKRRSAMRRRALREAEWKARYPGVAQ